MKTPPAEFYIDPARLSAERERVFARSWQIVGHVESTGESRRLLHDAARQRAAAVHERRRHDPRLLQRLPPSRRSDRLRLRQGAAPGVPLSRLDLRPRRPAAAHDGDGRRGGVRSDADPAAERESASLRAAAVRGARSRDARVRRNVSRRERALRAARAGAHGLRRDARVSGEGQLEGVRRQLPRGLSHPAGASRAQSRDRLSTVRHRARRASHAAARAGARGQRALQGQGRRRPGVLLLAVPEHHAEHLRRPAAVERRDSDRRRQHGRALRLVRVRAVARSADRTSAGSSWRASARKCRQRTRRSARRCSSTCTRAPIAAVRTRRSAKAACACFTA